MVYKEREVVSPAEVSKLPAIYYKGYRAASQIGLINDRTVEGLKSAGRDTGNGIVVTTSLRQKKYRVNLPRYAR